MKHMEAHEKNMETQKHVEAHGNTYGNNTKKTPGNAWNHIKTHGNAWNKHI